MSLDHVWLYIISPSRLHKYPRREEVEGQQISPDDGPSNSLPVAMAYDWDNISPVYLPPMPELPHRVETRRAYLEWRACQ